MEIKERKKLDYLPNVFLLPDGNKISVTDKFINCEKYISRSRLTFQGCFEVSILENKIKVDKAKETNGIYYTPNPPIFNITFKQKIFRKINDIKSMLINLDLSKVSLKSSSIIIKYDNYSIQLFDIYYKGEKLEFSPAFYPDGKQGHLSVYEVPPLKIEKINEELFEKTRIIGIYNHIIEFDINVLKYKQLHIMPGEGALVYLPEPPVVKIISPEHDNVGFTEFGGKWLLFSHPVPKKNPKD
ncbi:hypothetical protein SIRV1gp40 [Sulfolobus islandicus rod-shaped virus 1]|uniref:Uncharacterized protein 241 n=1 Tax=Sulfolobus islandicus rod-shaped virus 1 TaxID=157898 RepID=Y241_SIRV1|nr:hypothetical protein SIRV1gp40 [Sulfolobus islandicus rod-shaped virus 1]Q8QL16.1 RecName: Full=Uncharacterized protein 241 [Sulfolobus islandicus rod-shaped virus 1]CAC93995.1 hypothetical protein [Sulfolobus islandicus rod-shaped virus 1]CAG38859.1 hypothetical protein [Sulfolobus islandicus rudivirus 1 variant XX]